MRIPGPLHRASLLAAAAALALAGCAGDPGADTGLPTCNARPVDPAGYQPGAASEVEAGDHVGHRYPYTGPNGERLVFHYGLPSDAGSGLPSAGRLPLTTVGAGQLFGEGSEWAFVWNESFPCDPMSVSGTGIGKNAFVTVLGMAQVIPREEEEGEAGAEVPGQTGEAEEIEEELEGEIEEGVLPPGGPSVQFVAVFTIAEDLDGLEPSRERIEDAAGGSAWFGPVDCWRGLAKQLNVPRDRWVAGMAALTRSELDFYVDRMESVPVFAGQLKRTAGCTV